MPIDISPDVEATFGLREQPINSAKVRLRPARARRVACLAGGDRNDFSEILFEPTDLRNTATVYRSAADYFHGFPPLERGSFRWTINAQYAAVADDLTRPFD